MGIETMSQKNTQENYEKPNIPEEMAEGVKAMLAGEILNKILAEDKLVNDMEIEYAEKEYKTQEPIAEVINKIEAKKIAIREDLLGEKTTETNQAAATKIIQRLNILIKKISNSDNLNN